MNKKLSFTICSVLLVFTALFMACQKSTSNAVTTATTGSTTTSTGPNTIVIDGSSHTVATGTNVIGGNYSVISTTPLGYPTISVYFSGSNAPAAGTYTAAPDYPSSGNCGAILSPTTSVTWTVVTCHPTVTSGSSRNVSFTNSTFTDGTNTHTVSVNLPF